MAHALESRSSDCLITNQNIADATLLHFQGCAIKSYAVHSEATGILACGALSRRVRTLTPLRYPCCMEAQAIRKNPCGVLQDSPHEALDSTGILWHQLGTGRVSNPECPKQLNLRITVTPGHLPMQSHKRCEVMYALPSPFQIVRKIKSLFEATETEIVAYITTVTEMQTKLKSKSIENTETLISQY